MTLSRETIFSPGRVYRYTLWRSWGDLLNQDNRYVAFCCLNPSTADEFLDDPTVRRCIDFAKRWSFVNYCMVNLFAFRATDPKEMMKFKGDKVGPDNDLWILDVAKDAEVFICAWGNDGDHNGRCYEVVRRLASASVHLSRLGERTNQGQPRHPLYLKSDLKPIPL